MANDTDYGLSATIWTEDIDKGKRISGGVDSGVIWINTWLLRDLRTPFGGMKNSGLGREGGDDALDFLQNKKYLYSQMTEKYQKHLFVCINERPKDSPRVTA